MSVSISDLGNLSTSCMNITRASRSTCTPRKHYVRLTILMQHAADNVRDYIVNDTSTSLIHSDLKKYPVPWCSGTQ